MWKKKNEENVMVVKFEIWKSNWKKCELLICPDLTWKGECVLENSFVDKVKLSKNKHSDLLFILRKGDVVLWGSVGNRCTTAT